MPDGQWRHPDAAVIDQKAACTSHPWRRDGRPALQFLNSAGSQNVHARSSEQDSTSHPPRQDARPWFARRRDVPRQVRLHPGWRLRRRDEAPVLRQSSRGKSPSPPAAGRTCWSLQENWGRNPAGTVTDAGTPPPACLQEPVEWPTRTRSPCRGRVARAALPSCVKGWGSGAPSRENRRSTARAEGDDSEAMTQVGSAAISLARRAAADAAGSAPVHRRTTRSLCAAGAFSRGPRRGENVS